MRDTTSLLFDSFRPKKEEEEEEVVETTRRLSLKRVGPVLGRDELASRSWKRMHVHGRQFMIQARYT